MAGASVANCSSWGSAGSDLWVFAYSMTSPSSWPSGSGSAPSHNSRAVSPFFTQAPFCAADPADIHAVGKVIDAPAGDRIAFLDGPFHRRQVAHAQQRGVIADAAGASKPAARVPANPGVAMAVTIRSVPGAISEATTSFGSAWSPPRCGCLRRRCHPVLAVMHDDTCDFHAVRLEHVQGRHAEMTGADKGNPMTFLPWGTRIRMPRR